MERRNSTPLREKKIEDFHEIEDIINKSLVCHLGLSEGDKPYVLPFNFGYENKTIYIHSAPEGKKVDIIAKNNNVCLSFDIDHLLFHRDKEVACSYGMKYRSVIVTGKIYRIEDYDEKVRIMNLIMKKYTGEEFKFNSPAIKNVNVYRIEADEITGKKYGY